MKNKDVPTRFTEYSEYRKGYFQSLLSLENLLESYSDDLSYYKVISKKDNKNMRMIIDGLLNNLDAFMKWGEDVSIHYDDKKRIITIGEHK